MSSYSPSIPNLVSPINNTLFLQTFLEYQGYPSTPMNGPFKIYFLFWCTDQSVSKEQF